MKFHLSLLLLAAFFSIPVHVSAGVVSHYSFDSDYTDDSGNGNHGNLVDVATAGDSGIIQSAGDYMFGGGAMNFSEDRDYIEIPSRTFSSGVAYTIAFWARKAEGDTGDPAQWDMVAGQRDNANFFIALNDASGVGSRTGIRWRSSDGTAARNLDAVSPSDPDWHHYAVVVSGTTLTVYLDGEVVVSGTGKLTGFILDTIGEAYSTVRDFDFHGQIDEFWVFDEALERFRIQGLFATNDSNVSAPVVRLHYRFDGDFLDSSTSENHGVASGTAATSAVPGDVAIGTGALVLDGADDSFVALSTAITFGATDPWTITWWAQRGEHGGSKGMVMGVRGDASNFIWLNDGFTGLRFRSASAATHDLTVFQDLEMHHYALVADGAGNLTFFLDGDESEKTAGDTSFAMDTVGLAYPTSSLKYAFQGVLDDVNVFSLALGTAEIGQIFNGGGYGDTGFSIRSVNFDDITRDVSIRWDAVVGRTYRIDYSEDLVEWITLDNSHIADSIDEIYVDEATPAPIFNRYYRLGLP